ncbi:hypothetical protein PHET_11609 [Paragonimus heterotremus]|uniref:Uncharacterized protein n=1 Tax=Paragonimus heterotremus TaxID=100268 RepID=A0A8J4T0P1_9TREM|nr:hypothetical protein PHET_11609 [Paragonimus heterotremus]
MKPTERAKLLRSQNQPIENEGLLFLLSMVSYLQLQPLFSVKLGALSDLRRYARSPIVIVCAGTALCGIAAWSYKRLKCILRVLCGELLVLYSLAHITGKLVVFVFSP